MSGRGLVASRSDTSPDEPLRLTDVNQTVGSIDPSRLRAAEDAVSDWINERALSYSTDLARLSYVGPLREPPVRFNILTGERTSGVGARGEHLVEMLVRQPRLIRDTNKWLERLGVPYEVDVRQVNDGNVEHAIGDMHYMLLRDRRTGVHVSPTDVGFGIGQVLPVVVQAVSHRGLLCVEQPELHLHPAMQSELAELFVEQIQRRPGGNQYILETHSEHLVLRVQRLIRRRALDPEDVLLLHVGQEDTGAEARVHQTSAEMATSLIRGRLASSTSGSTSCSRTDSCSLPFASTPTLFETQLGQNLSDSQDSQRTTGHFSPTGPSSQRSPNTSGDRSLDFSTSRKHCVRSPRKRSTDCFQPP